MCNLFLTATSINKNMTAEESKSYYQRKSPQKTVGGIPTNYRYNLLKALLPYANHHGFGIGVRQANTVSEP